MFRPVTAPDYVAGPSRCRLDAIGPGKERVPICRKHQFWARLRCAVGIPSSERIGLTVAPFPVLVTIALVGRDVDKRANTLDFPDRFADVDVAHGVATNTCGACK